MEVIHEELDVNIHTLGPAGTNCEAAANDWLRNKKVTGSVILHDTLEEAMESLDLDESSSSVLLGCVVYPELHNLVFKNRHISKIVECFVYPTLPMLLAVRDKNYRFGVVASHPAPVALIPDKFERIQYVNSNSAAARLCAKGGVDACITTEKAAAEHGLMIVEDYGPIPMGFTVHGKSK